eukprot:238638-Rhodomonas_salina.1
MTVTSLHAHARFSLCGATRGFESHCTSRHASSFGFGQLSASWLGLNSIRATGASSAPAPRATSTRI